METPKIRETLDENGGPVGFEDGPGRPWEVGVGMSYRGSEFCTSKGRYGDEVVVRD